MYEIVFDLFEDLIVNILTQSSLPKHLALPDLVRFYLLKEVHVVACFHLLAEGSQPILFVFLTQVLDLV